MNNEIFNTNVLPGFEQIAIYTPVRRRKKLGKLVNQKLLYRESDLLDVGLVVQKARKQGVQSVTVGFDSILPRFCKFIGFFVLFVGYYQTSL